METSYQFALTFFLGGSRWSVGFKTLAKNVLALKHFKAPGLTADNNKLTFWGGNLFEIQIFSLDISHEQKKISAVSFSIWLYGHITWDLRFQVLFSWWNSLSSCPSILFFYSLSILPSVRPSVIPSEIFNARQWKLRKTPKIAINDRKVVSSDPLRDAT